MAPRVRTSGGGPPVAELLGANLKMLERIESQLRALLEAIHCCSQSLGARLDAFAERQVEITASLERELLRR